MIFGVQVFDEILFRVFQVFVLILQQVVSDLCGFWLLCLIRVISGGLSKISKSNKFEIFKFDGKHFTMWKVKIHGLVDRISPLRGDEEVFQVIITGFKFFGIDLRGQ